MPAGGAAAGAKQLQGRMVYPPGRGEGQGWHVTVDPVTVVLQEGAQVGESAFFKVHAVGPVPRHHLPVVQLVNM